MTMTGNDRGLIGKTSCPFMTPLKINKPLHLYIVRWSGSSLHAARYAERGGDSRQDYKSLGFYRSNIF